MAVSAAILVLAGATVALSDAGDRSSRGATPSGAQAPLKPDVVASVIIRAISSVALQRISKPVHVEARDAQNNTIIGDARALATRWVGTAGLGAGEEVRVILLREDAWDLPTAQGDCAARIKTFQAFTCEVAADGSRIIQTIVRPGQVIPGFEGWPLARTDELTAIPSQNLRLMRQVISRAVDGTTVLVEEVVPALSPSEAEGLWTLSPEDLASIASEMSVPFSADHSACGWVVPEKAAGFSCGPAPPRR
jgi:hypothetical protein